MSLNTDKLNGVDFTPTPRTDRVWAQGYDSDYPVNGINNQLKEALAKMLPDKLILVALAKVKGIEI